LKHETQLRSEHPLPRRNHALKSPSMVPGRVRLLWSRHRSRTVGLALEGKTHFQIENYRRDCKSTVLYMDVRRSKLSKEPPSQATDMLLNYYSEVYELVRGFGGISGPSRACVPRETPIADQGPCLHSPFSVLQAPCSGPCDPAMLYGPHAGRQQCVPCEPTTSRCGLPGPKRYARYA
jgi:hypothetical protein